VHGDFPNALYYASCALNFGVHGSFIVKQNFQRNHKKLLNKTERLLSSSQELKSLTRSVGLVKLNGPLLHVVSFPESIHKHGILKVTT
jgi:hypothetical protein